MFNWFRLVRIAVLIVVIVVLVVLYIALLGAGCKTYEPVWEPKLTAECNMALNTYKLYFESKDKSAVMPTMEYCYKSLHRRCCQEEVFGRSRDSPGMLNPVDYTDTIKYRNYSQCLNELK